MPCVGGCRSALWLTFDGYVHRKGPIEMTSIRPPRRRYEWQEGMEMQYMGCLLLRKCRFWKRRVKHYCKFDGGMALRTRGEEKNERKRVGYVFTPPSPHIVRSSAVHARRTERSGVTHCGRSSLRGRNCDAPFCRHRLLYGGGGGGVCVAVAIVVVVIIGLAFAFVWP
jgi:hypothetical protein